MKKKNKLLLYCAFYCILSFIAFTFIMELKVIAPYETQETESEPLPQAESESLPQAETEAPPVSEVKEPSEITDHSFPIDFVNRTKSNVHIRNEASMKGKIIGRIPSGQKGIITDFFNTEWAMISYNGLDGYSAFRYFNVTSPLKNENVAFERVSQNETNTGNVVILNNCYIRSSTNSHTLENVIDIANKNSIYPHITENDTEFWCCIRLMDGRIGYVSNVFLELME